MNNRILLLTLHKNVTPAQDPLSAGGVRARFSLLILACGLVATPALTQTSSPGHTLVAWGSYIPAVTYDIPTNFPPNLTNLIAISASDVHAIALRSDGSVVSWGFNGDPNYPTGQTNVPSGLTNVVKVAAGASHSLALKADGTVVGWGLPVGAQVPAGLSNVISVAAGARHSLALKTDGTVVGWGDNAVGAINVPVGLSNVVAISATGHNSFAIRANGTVAMWGLNASRFPVPQDLTNVVAVTGNYQDFLIALKADGTVRVWGEPVFGEGQVPAAATNLVAIEVAENLNGSRVVGLRSNGTVLAWGDAAPVVTNLPFATAIAAGVQDFALVNPAQAATPPTILSSPKSQTAAVGSSVTLYVWATGYGPLQYQWYHNDTNALAGATNSFLTLANVESSQAGRYHARVTNQAGTSSSQTAVLSVLSTLEVTTAPVITLKGDVGVTYRLDYVNAVGDPAAWTPLATVTPTESPYRYVDLSAIGQPARFYRAVLLK